MYEPALDRFAEPTWAEMNRQADYEDALTDREERIYEELNVALIPIYERLAGAVSQSAASITDQFHSLQAEAARFLAEEEMERKEDSK